MKETEIKSSLFSSEIFLKDPETIIITSSRQRVSEKEAEIEDLVNSIREVGGVIHPIVITKNENNQDVLVAGERRLIACKQLGIQIPCRYYSSLDPLDIERVELEENAKRRNLPWRDYINAVGKYHINCRKRNGETWAQKDTAFALSIDRGQLSKLLTIYENLDSPRLSTANSVDQAFNILQRFSERKTGVIITEIASMGSSIFGKKVQEEEETEEETEAEETPETKTDAKVKSLPQFHKSKPRDSNNSVSSLSLPNKPPIICTNFLSWITDFSDEKFNFIHCDFEDNRDLIDCFFTNLPKLLSHSAHVMFWLDMRRYEEIRFKFHQSGLNTTDRPLIWLKSDLNKSAPGANKATQPRHIYETAILATKNSRNLLKQTSNGYAAPSVSNPIHPSQKPEPVLRFFFSMLIDETTVMLDPAAGSGTSIRVAEEYKAKHVLGIEIDEGYCKAANAACIRSRALRIMGR